MYPHAWRRWNGFARGRVRSGSALAAACHPNRRGISFKEHDPDHAGECAADELKPNRLIGAGPARSKEFEVPVSSPGPLKAPRLGLLRQDVRT